VSAVGSPLRPAAAARPDRAPVVPPAVRLARPRWRDGRLLAGVVLVLASVALGARTVAVAGHTTGVLVAAADLPAGHRLTAADLTALPARLDGRAAGRYLAAGAASRLLGQVLLRDVGRGEYLPAAGVAPRPEQPWRDVPVQVPSALLPGIGSGSRVDLVVATKASGDTRGTTRPLLADVPVLAVRAAGTGDSTVRLRVPVADVLPVLSATNGGQLLLVAQPALGAPGSLPDAPSAADAQLAPSAASSAVRVQAPAPAPTSPAPAAGASAGPPGSRSTVPAVAPSGP
jgi:Flp pilus assembly protein CpaB